MILKISQKMYKHLPIFLFLNLYVSISAQSVSGMTGLISIPTAEISSDADVTFGVTYMPKEMTEYSHHVRDIISPHVTLGFLPFLEIGASLVRQLDYHGDSHNVDRILSLKLQVIKEDKYLPAFALGIHSVPSDTRDATHFQALYGVLTKNFHQTIIFDNISLTLGYGSDAIKAADHEFVGIFGGASFDFSLLTSNFSLLLENDAIRWNGGVRITLFNHIRLLAGLMEFRHFTGGVSVGWSLL